MFFLMIILFVNLVAVLIATLLGLFIYNYLSKDDEISTTKSDEAILITGCDSGIGLELARHFHKTCNFKIICGFLNPDESEGFKELLDLSQQDERHRLILSKLDLTSSGDIESVVDKIEEMKCKKVFESLIAVINNAGIMTYGEFDWLTWDQINTQIEVNFIGTIRLTRALVPYIIDSKGRIINVSSVNDVTVFPGLSIYSATKSAVSTFSRGLGYELRKFGVHVVTVRLGDFARLTNIMARHASKQDDMWNGMNQKKRVMYKDFFHEFNRHLMDNYGMTSPKEFQDSSLFKDFNRAVLAKKPPTTITCAPIGFRIFYIVIEMTPVWIQYHLLDILIQVGFRWRPPQVAT